MGQLTIVCVYIFRLNWSCWLLWFAIVECWL